MTVRVSKRGRPLKATTALVPAASRAPEVLTDEEASLNADAIATFVRVVGGKDALIDTLSVASTAPEIDRIVTLLLDPRYDRYTLKRLCTLAGITVADLFAAYKKALIAKAHIEASQIIASKLPPIVTDVMDRALSDPTVERHKLALELGQLTERKGGGLIVNQTQGVIAASGLTAVGSGALEQLQQAVGDLLYSKRHATTQVIDPRDPPFPLEEPGEPTLPFADPTDDTDDDDDETEDDDEPLS